MNYTTENTLTFTGGNSCTGGHTWFYSVGTEVQEGTPCGCGMTQYKKPKYCSECGQQMPKQI